MRKPTEMQRIADKSIVLSAVMIPAVYDYGLRVLMLCAAAASISMLTELICLYLRHDPFRLRHLDAAVTGVILTMLMPPTVPLSLLMMSCIFAIIIGRQVFGGKDHPLFPPAAVGYCFALLNQKAAILSFPAEKGIISLFSPENTEVMTGISEVWNHSADFRFRTTELLLGLPRQPIGTGSLLLLLTAAAVLMIRRSASVWAMFPMLCAIIGGNLLVTWYHDPMPVVYASLLTNQTLFSAMFLFSDPDYVPPGVYGSLYGLFCGLLCLIFTRLTFVTDAPVILAVLTAPIAMFLRYLIAFSAKRQNAAEGGLEHHEDRTEPLSSSSESAAL